MEKIRILHVGMDTHLGGIETFLLSMVQHMDRERFHFTFLGYDDQKPYFHEELAALGCDFRYVRSRRKGLLKNKADLERLFQVEHYDVVHCNQNSLSNSVPALVALKQGIPVIVQSHNGGSVKGLTSFLNSLNRIRFPFDRVTALAVSDIAGKWMFGEKCAYQVLNNGVDTEKFRYFCEQRILKRKELGLSSDDEVFISVGAFREQKNHRFMIDIFHAYQKKHAKAKLVLVGTGGLSDEIVAKVNALGLDGNVLFLGARRDIPQLLSCADKFLFPSLYEGFPIALIEAEANGLSCIVSSVISEQACLENSVRVSLDSSVDDWVRAMEISAPECRDLYADLVAKAGFGIETEIRILENLYSSLSEQKRGE